MTAYCSCGRQPVERGAYQLVDDLIVRRFLRTTSRLSTCGRFPPISTIPRKFTIPDNHLPARLGAQRLIGGSAINPTSLLPSRPGSRGAT